MGKIGIKIHFDARETDQLRQLPKDLQRDWERQSGEPAHWYARFYQYLHQEPPRSVMRVYRHYLEQQGEARRGKKAIQAVESLPHGWAAARDKYHWLDRADAYDRWQMAEQEKKREERRLLQEQHELEDAFELRGKAQELIAFPTTIQEEQAMGEDGQPQHITMMPADPTVFRVAERLYRGARESARISLKMPMRYISKDIDLHTDGLTTAFGVIVLPANDRDKPLPPEDWRGELARQQAVVELPDRDPLPDDEDEAEGQPHLNGKLQH